MAFLSIAVEADLAARYWSRKAPSPLPAGLRFLLRVPRPLTAFHNALLAMPRERVLEVGPGLGQNAVAVARWLQPGGRLDVLDVQQPMLDATMARARAEGVENIVPTLADASGTLPYEDATFDAAYMLHVLGEVADRDQVLRELRRVLKPDGRLVVGELLIDPDFVRLAELERVAGEAGFRMEARHGPAFYYHARLVKDAL